MKRVRSRTLKKFTNILPTINYTVNSVISNLSRPQGTQIGGRAIGQVRDLLIIVDASSSIGAQNFDIAKTQLANLLGLLCPTPDPFKSIQQAALIEFSDLVVEKFDFNDNMNTLQLQQAIKAMPYTAENTCTAMLSIMQFKCSKLVKTYHNNTYNLMLCSGARSDPNVRKEVLILTDGQSNCGGDATAAAITLQNTAAVYGLMIGDSNSVQGQEEIESYVSKPLNEHLFALSDFRELDTLLIGIKEELLASKERCAPFDID